jgi:hypothetical protein
MKVFCLMVNCNYSGPKIIPSYDNCMALYLHTFNMPVLDNSAE